MNERITLLALKASDPKNGWLDRQKFAELIIKECVGWVNDNVGLMDEEAKADLLKHFGGTND